MMSVEALAGAIACLGACAGCGALAVSAYRRTSEFISPWSLFLAMSVFDVFLPAALFLLGVPVPVAPWVRRMEPLRILNAVAVFLVSAALFAAGYWAASKSLPATETGGRRPTISADRAYLLLVGATVVYAIYVAANVAESGSIGTYYADRIARRFRPYPMTGSSPLLVFVYQLGASMLPVVFMAIGALFTSRRRAPFVRGVLLPLLGLLLAMTTLFRGVILTYAMGLAILETARIKDSLGPLTARASAVRLARLRKRLVAGCVAALLCFAAYGAVRNFFTMQAWGKTPEARAAALMELSRVVRGEGLIGLAAVLEAFPDRLPLMAGKTIVDMLLLPVPRSVWPSKPAWYGITDITLAMGWPASTMSPVTMPGELYANFGLVGIGLMALYGVIFGVAARCRLGSRFRYAYAFAVVPGMLPTFWMGFTGLVNNLLPVPLMLFAATAVLVRPPASSPEGIAREEA